VFLDLKFAEKFEQKACLNITEEEYGVSEDGGNLLVTARCVEDNKLYKLNLTLYEAIRPSEPTEEDEANRQKDLEEYNEYVIEHNKWVVKHNKRIGTVEKAKQARKAN